MKKNKPTKTSETKSITLVLSRTINLLSKHNKFGITIDQLYEDISAKVDISKREIYIILKFFSVFGAVWLEDEEPIGHTRVIIKSILSDFFLKSINRYLVNNFKIINDWESLGSDPNTHIANLTRGIEFIDFLENRRVNELEDKTPIRKVDVSVGIIKANIIGFDQPCYLCRFDDKSKKYQLIGGWNKTDEKNDKLIVTKTIQELNMNKLVYNLNFTIKKIASGFKDNVLSSTYGTYTSYNFKIYQIFLHQDKIRLSEFDKWISEDELLGRKSTPGVNVSNYNHIDIRIDGGFAGLPLSIEKPQSVKKELNIITGKKSHTVKIMGVKDFIKLGESSKLEFKSSLRWDFRLGKVNKVLEMNVIKTLASLLNSDGGILLIGLSDKSNIVGIQKDIDNLHKKDNDGFEQQIFNIVSSYLGSESTKYIEVDFEEVEEQIVAIIRVSKADQPVFTKLSGVKEFYIRGGNASRILDAEEAFKYINSHW